MDGEKEQLDREEEERKSRSRTRGVEQSFLSPSSDQKSELGTFSSCQRCSLSSEADFISLTNNNQPDNKL